MGEGEERWESGLRKKNLRGTGKYIDCTVGSLSAVAGFHDLINIGFRDWNGRRKWPI